jgi:hypothetical protein
MNKEVRSVGTDPGTVYHGICQVAFRGFKLSQDEETKQWVKMPSFDILNWELWDLKHKITYRYDKEKLIIKNKYGATGLTHPAVEDFLSLCINTTRFISDSPWLFERYQSSFFGDKNPLPVIAGELQCGQIKNHEYDVFLVSYSLPSAIKAIDFFQNNFDREVLSRARKYGIPSDGSLTHDERKLKSEQIGRALLHMAGMEHLIDFLDAMLVERKHDLPFSKQAPKVHDLTDAFLLALYVCITMYENLEKQELRDGGIITNTPVIEIVIKEEEDLSEEQDVLTVIEKQKAKPKVTVREAKKRSLKRAYDEMAQDMDDVAKNKKKKKKTKSQKKQKQDLDEEEVVVVKKKKKKDETADAHVKYSELKFILPSQKKKR